MNLGHMLGAVVVPNGLYTIFDTISSVGGIYGRTLRVATMVFSALLGGTVLRVLV